MISNLKKAIRAQSVGWACKTAEAKEKSALKKMGSMLNASQRKDVTETLAHLRTHGLNSAEVRKSLDKKVLEGKLSKFEEKRLKRELGVKRKSWF